MKKPTTSGRYLAQKREELRLDRIQDHNRARRSRFERLPIAEAFKNQNAKMLALLCKKNPYSRSQTRTTAPLQVPSVFSFVHNATETVDFLLRVAAVARNRDVRRVRLWHRDCQQIGLGAEGMLGLLVQTMDQQGKHIRGVVPSDPEMRRLVWAIGSPRFLGVAQIGDDEIREGKLRVLRHRSTLLEGFTDIRSADPKGKAIAKILAHLDACLIGHGTTLTPETQMLLVRYLGEIIGNAEEHAGIVDWTVMSYLDNMISGVHICELSIFNFGNTIAETFTNLPAADPGRVEIEAYVSHHETAGFFKPHWNEMDLRTAVAMQGHISCKKAQDPTRGNGTVEAISVFQELSTASFGEYKGPPVTMSIVSGSTQILLDGTYPMKKDHTGRSVIAFNTTNDLRLPPDAKYVRNLGGLHLPATVISIRFPLLPEYVTKQELK